MLERISHGVFPSVSGSQVPTRDAHEENSNWILFAILGMFFCLWILGCASTESLTTVTVDEPDRIRELEEKIALRDEQIERLQNRLAALDLNRGKKKEAPLKPVTPAREPHSVRAESLLPDFAESTLADSSQESMHFYFEALSQLKVKAYEKALQSLHRFLAMDPQHVYADRAQYLIAHTHFQNKEYGLTVVASNLLEARYPFSFKLPDSLYERALAYLEMKQAGSARQTLQRLVQNYPDTPRAALAAKKIAELGPALPPAPAG